MRSRSWIKIAEDELYLVPVEFVERWQWVEGVRYRLDSESREIMRQLLKKYRIPTSIPHDQALPPRQERPSKWIQPSEKRLERNTCSKLDVGRDGSNARIDASSFPLLGSSSVLSARPEPQTTMTASTSPQSAAARGHGCSSPEWTSNDCPPSDYPPSMLSQPVWPKRSYANVVAPSPKSIPYNTPLLTPPNSPKRNALTKLFRQLGTKKGKQSTDDRPRDQSIIADSTR